MDLLIFFNQSLPIIFFPFFFGLNQENEEKNAGSEDSSPSSDLNKSLLRESREKFKKFKNFLQKIVNISHLGIILSFFGEAFLVQIYKYHFLEELLLLLAGITWMVGIFVLNGEFKRNGKYILVKLFWILSLLSEVLIFGKQSKNMNKFYMDFAFFFCKITRIIFLTTLNLYLIDEKFDLFGKYVFKLRSAQSDVINEDFENPVLNENLLRSPSLKKTEEEKLEERAIKSSLRKKNILIDYDEIPLERKLNMETPLKKQQIMETPIKNNSEFKTPVKETPLKSKRTNRSNKFEKLRITNKVCLTEQKRANTNIDNNSQNSSGIYRSKRSEDEMSSNYFKGMDFEIENVEVLRNKEKIQYLFFLKCIKYGRVKSWKIIKTYNELSELNSKLEINSSLNPKYFETIPKVSSYIHATTDSFIEERRIAVFNYMNKIIKTLSLRNETLFKFLSFNPDRNTPYVISPHPTLNQDSLVFCISFLSNHTYHPSPFPLLRSPKNLFFPTPGKTTHGISFQKVRIILSSIKGCVDDGTTDFKLVLTHYKQKTNIAISCPNYHPLGKVENEIFLIRSNSNEPKKSLIYEMNNSNNGAYKGQELEKNTYELMNRKRNFTKFAPKTELQDFLNEEEEEKKLNLPTNSFLINKNLDNIELDVKKKIISKFYPTEPKPLIPIIQASLFCSDFSEEVFNSPSVNKIQNENFKAISFQHTLDDFRPNLSKFKNIQFPLTPIHTPSPPLKNSLQQQIQPNEIDKIPSKVSQDSSENLANAQNKQRACNEQYLNQKEKTQNLCTDQHFITPESIDPFKHDKVFPETVNFLEVEKPSNKFVKLQEGQMTSTDRKVSAKNLKTLKNDNFLFFVYGFLLEERWENLWEPRTTIKFTSSYKEIKNMHEIICNLGQNFDRFQEEAALPEDLEESEIGRYDEPKYRGIKQKWEEYFGKVLKIPGIEENESFKSLCCLDRLESGWEFNRPDIENLDFSMY